MSGKETAAAFLPGPGDHGPARVIIPAPADPRHAHLGWPRTFAAADGTIYLACLAAREHTVGGCPAVAVSSDGGRTFSPLHFLADYDRGGEYTHSGNLAIGAAADGAVVILAMAMTAGRTRGDIFGWRREPGSAAWQPVDTVGLGGSVYGNLVPVPGRGLLVFGHCREGSPLGPHGLWSACSRDGGRHWSAPVLITSERLVEPSFRLVGERIVGLAKGRQAVGYRQFVSADRGLTWRAGDSGIGRRANMTSPALFNDPARPSRLIACETQRAWTDEAGEAHPGYIRLWTAEAGDLSWSPGARLAVFRPADPAAGAGRPDYGYPWLAALGPERWSVVFYCGWHAGANAVWGLELAAGPRVSSTRGHRPG